MSQIGRTVKNLEAPRPLKSTSRQTHHSQLYEVQSIEELITLTENVAASLASGHSNTESMTILSANLRSHGPQLEMISKDTLDRAFVTFRNASQDERLSIITRMNLLELIELRAKLWQNSDGINTYYKHKATDVQPDNLAINDLSMLSTSPPATNALGQQQQQPLILGPGELIRPSGKFTKPTKIPGKNYSKDEVVIRNADSGKVNPGAKERLVQITGPNEDKINYAKSLIEDTIRRNASPVRLEAPQDGSCSSLASSISDDATSRANRNSVGAMIASSGGGGGIGIGITGGAGIGSGGIHPNNYVPNQNAGFHNSNNTNNNNNNTNAMIGIGGGAGGGIGIGGLHGLNNLNSKFSRNSTGGGGGQLLLHSLSTNDASLGEYKYTVGIGHHTIKITGDCFELVRVAKLVLDDYFSSNEFLASVEAGATLDNTLSSSSSSSLPMNASSIGGGGGGGGFVSPGATGSGHHHPTSHQLISSSPFADSGIGLNLMGSSSGPLINNIGNINQNNNNNNTNNNNNSSIEVDDDVFIVENDSSSNSSSSNSTVTSSATHGKSGTVASSSSAAPTNGLTRSRRSHFSRKESTPDTKDKELLSNSMRIVHEYERLIFYAKSPHSWVLPRDWNKITEKHPTIIRNKVNRLSESSVNLTDIDYTNNNNNNTNNSNVDRDNNNNNNNNNNITKKGIYGRSISLNST